MNNDIDPDDFRIPTIEELDAMRVACNLPQAELSRRAGFEDSRFNDILHQDLDPQTETMRALLDVLQEVGIDEPEDRSDVQGPKPKPSPAVDPGEDETADEEGPRSSPPGTLAEKLEKSDPGDLVTDGGVDQPEKTAQIEMLYQQRMTVEIPVRNVPQTPRDAFHLVKNTDPEFVADVIPNRWDDLTTTGSLDVVDIEEVNDDDE